MKQVSPILESRIKAEVTSICTCWRLERLDGEVYRWTDHDNDLEVHEELYLSAFYGGFDRTAIESSLGLEATNLELLGFLGHSLTRKELNAGLFDHARLDVMLVDWQRPDLGVVEMRSGTLGEVRMTTENLFEVELLGLLHPFKQVIGENYTPECRANFCDSRCGLKLENYTVDAQIDEVIHRRKFVIDKDLFHIIEAVWDFGVVRFEDGVNAGRPVEVKRMEGREIELKFALPDMPEVGDSVKVSAGCDQRLSTCRYYGNVVNFRGEPYVPGTTKVFSILGGG